MNKQTIFIQKRLRKLSRMYQDNPIMFTFVSGFENPADAITRPLSYKQLRSSNYLTGPAFLVSKDCVLSRADILTATIPSSLEAIPEHLSVGAECTSSLLHSVVAPVSHLLPISNFSHFRLLVGIHEKVLLFINNLKSRLKFKYPVKYSYFNILSNVYQFALFASRW